MRSRDETTVIVVVAEVNMDEHDFSQAYSEILQKSDIEFVTFDDKRGLFITRTAVGDYLEAVSKFTMSKLDEQRRRDAAQAEARMKALKGQLEDVNLILSKTQKREEVLQKDLAEMEAALKTAQEESREFSSTYEEQKQQYLSLIKRYKTQIDTLQKSKDVTKVQEELAEARAKGRETQKALDELKKTKGLKQSEIAVMRMRVAAFKAAIVEEGAHSIAIRNQFEDALRNQKTFSEYLSEYSQKASVALGISEVLNRIWAFDENPKESAWDLIELARKCDERNKLKCRDLATLAFTTVKTTPYKKRAKLLPLIKETASAISMGLSNEIREVSAKWLDIQNSSKVRKEEEALQEETLFDEVDLKTEKEVRKSLFPLKYTFWSSLKRRFTLAKMSLKSKIIRNMKSISAFKLSDLVPSFFKRSPGGAPSKFRILVGQFSAGLERSRRIGHNQGIIREHNRSPGDVPFRSYSKEECHFESCLARTTGLSKQVIQKFKLAYVRDFQSDFSDDEWVVLDYYLPNGGCDKGKRPPPGKIGKDRRFV